MKVLVISHMYPSNFNAMSGIFVHQQVKALIENGCEVKVISPIPWTPYPLNKISAKWRGYSNIPCKAIINSIEVFYPRYLEFPKGILFHKSGFFMSKGIKRVINKIYKDFKFEIIHSNVALPDGYSGMIINKNFKIPHLVTIHGQDFQNTINRNDKCRKAVFKMLNNADEIITVSNKLKDIVKSEGFYNKISVVNNGIDKICLTRNYSKEKLISGTKEIDKIKILSVSNLKKTKGIQFNLKALSKLKNIYKNIQYDIIGEGEYEEKLRDLVRELGLLKHVNFLGKKKHDEVIKYMNNYDIFSLPSYEEGFGMVYIEAMSQGIPVIGVKGEGIEDVVINGENGFLVNRKSTESLIEVLDRLIKDNELRNKLALRAKKTIIHNFTWDCNAKRIIKLYENLINKNYNL